MEIKHKPVGQASSSVSLDQATVNRSPAPATADEKVRVEDEFELLAPSNHTRASQAKLLGAKVPSRTLPGAAPSQPFDPLEHVRQIVAANPPVAPAELAPSPKAAPVIEALDSSRRVLLLCHAVPPPDDDTIGSAVALKRALELMGKQADVMVDGPVPGSIRPLLRRGELRRVGDDPSGDPTLAKPDAYDLTIMVDLSNPEQLERLAPYATEAKQLMVLDHHFCAGEVPELAWVDHHADATGVIVASLLAQWQKKNRRLGPEVWPQVSPLLQSALLRDSDLFRAEGLSPQTAGLFRHLLGGPATAELEPAVKLALCEPPVETSGILAHPPELRGQLAAPSSEEARSFRHRFDEVCADEMASRQLIEEELAVFAFPWQQQQLAIDVARHVTGDEEYDFGDLASPLYRTLNNAAQNHALALMLLEKEDGQIMVSVRSKEPLAARDLAQKLGGAGKPHMGGAVLATSMPEAMARALAQARAVMAETQREKELQQRTELLARGGF